MSNPLRSHDCSLQVPLCMWISQTRILEWIAISFYKGSFQSVYQTPSPALVVLFSTTEPPGKNLFTLAGGSEKILWRFISEGVLGMLSARSFIISSFIFRSLNHFEFTFVYNDRECSRFINLLIHYHFFENKSLTKWAISILLSGGVANWNLL